MSKSATFDPIFQLLHSAMGSEKNIQITSVSTLKTVSILDRETEKLRLLEKGSKKIREKKAGLIVRYSQPFSIIYKVECRNLKLRSKCGGRLRSREAGDNGGLDHKRGAGEFAQCGTRRVCFDQQKSQFGSNSWELFKMILWIFFNSRRGHFN